MLEDIVLKIDSVLPQTQCTKCGYDGCLPYAEAIAQGEKINRCPPGGAEGIAKLSELLNRPPLPLDPECGEEQPLHLARIIEEHCIGCTLCIQACPVDAIIGANKFMHTVDPESCTGCELCVPVCPVDCIEMYPAQRKWTVEDVSKARRHLHQRQQRLEQQSAVEKQRLAQAVPASVNSQTGTDAESEADAKKEAIAAALARARARRNAR